MFYLNGENIMKTQSLIKSETLKQILNDSRTYSLSGNEQEQQNVQDEQANPTNNREKIILIRKSQSESTPKLVRIALLFVYRFKLIPYLFVNA